MFTTSMSLLERLRDPQDEAAWQQLVALYTPLLHSWLRPHCAQQADVDDLTQDVLVVLSGKVKQFAHNRRMGAFRTWLRAIAAHKLGDHLRDSRRRAGGGGEEQARLLSQLEDPASDLSRVWERQHAQHVAAALLAHLRPEFSAPTWEAFHRLVVLGQSSAAASAALNVTPNAVLIAKSRVLARLRQELRAWEE
jgi:RNA polymerase sigma-70 factor (ECF subfamily)